MAKNKSERMCGAQLAAMLGISAMSLWRWERDTKLNFPRPTVIHDRKYWSRAAVNKWMRDTRRSARPAARESRREPSWANQMETPALAAPGVERL